MGSVHTIEMFQYSKAILKGVRAISTGAGVAYKDYHKEIIRQISVCIWQYGIFLSHHYMISYKFPL